MKEGEDYHIEMKLEIDPSLTVAQADDIKDRIRSRILEMKGVTHVIIEFDEDDGIRTYDEEATSLDLPENEKGAIADPNVLDCA